MGHLIVGRAVDVIENRGRHPTPRQASEIMKVVAIAEAHASTIGRPRADRNYGGGPDQQRRKVRALDLRNSRLAHIAF
jgi:hypothetical protein